MEEQSTGHDPGSYCSLTEDRLAERRGRWNALARRSLIDRAATESGVRLVFRKEQEVEEELRELIELEGSCCSFARFELESANGEAIVVISAPSASVAAVRKLFG